jgi:hypothetical protein
MVSKTFYPPIFFDEVFVVTTKVFYRSRCGKTIMPLRIARHAHETIFARRVREFSPLCVFVNFGDRATGSTRCGAAAR